jgi:hypothetical protein
VSGDWLLSATNADCAGGLVRTHRDLPLPRSRKGNFGSRVLESAGFFLVDLNTTEHREQQLIFLSAYSRGAYVLEGLGGVRERPTIIPMTTTRAVRRRDDNSRGKVQNAPGDGAPSAASIWVLIPLGGVVLAWGYTQGRSQRWTRPGG